MNRYVLTLVGPISAKELSHATGAPRQVTFWQGNVARSRRRVVLGQQARCALHVEVGLGPLLETGERVIELCQEACLSFAQLRIRQAVADHPRAETESGHRTVARHTPDSHEVQA